MWTQTRDARNPWAPRHPERPSHLCPHRVKPASVLTVDTAALCVCERVLGICVCVFLFLFCSVCLVHRRKTKAASVAPGPGRVANGATRRAERACGLMWESQPALCLFVTTEGFQGPVCVCVQLLSRVRLFVTPWTVARQAPLSMGFSRQEHWSGLPCPPPGDLPDPGIEHASPALQAGSLPLSHLPGT